MSHLQPVLPTPLPRPAGVVAVGAVSFTNTLPLVEGLDDVRLQREYGFELTRDTPRRLADRLHAGELDVALIPVAEFLRGDYRLLTTSCIGCLGPVRSVVLAGERPIGACERVLLDANSRTSNALTRLLYRHLWTGSPQFVDAAHDLVAPPRAGGLPARCDAAVVIGDRALRIDGAFPHVEDLGAAWFELTNLPFVFAVWAVRDGVDLGPIPGVLCRAARLGHENAARISRDRAAEMGVGQDYLFEYLTEFVRYRLGDRELAGIETFYRLLRDEGLCPELEQLRFYSEAA